MTVADSKCENEGLFSNQAVAQLMDNKYAGMTVNERLYLSGLLDEFEKAVSEKNTEEAVRILKKVDLTDASIKPIVEKWGL